MLANILRGFFFRQHAGSYSKSRQHVGQQMLASNVGQNVVSICASFKPLLTNELKDAFFSIKINKSSGVYDVSFNIIKKVLCGALRTLNLTISAIS